MKISRRTISLTIVMLALMVLIPLFVGGGASAQSGRGDSEQNTARAVLKKYFEHTLSRARELAAEKKFNSALKIVSGVIALDPAPDIVSRARNLLEAIENARILAEVLEAEVETDADVYETGETVRISVRLYNRGLVPVVIPLRFKDKKTIFGTKKVPVPNRIRIKYTTLDFYIGGVVRSIYNTSDEFNEEIRLEPGEFWEKQVDLKLDPYMPGRGVVRNLSISLRLTPVIYEQDGKQRVWYHYQTPRKTINVLPVGASQYRSDPLKSALTALEERDGMALLYSVGSADNRQRAILLPTMISHLEKMPTNSPMERYLIVALQHITGKYGRLKKNMWLAWWRTGGEEFLRRLYPAMRRTVFSVEIAPDGTLSCDKKVLTTEQVEDRVKTFINNGGVEFVIRCSKKAEFSHVAGLMDMMNAAGAGNIRIFAAENNDGSETDE